MEEGEPLFDPGRFLQAQESGAAYAQALSELRRGHKSSHWIWFVFPQLAGLGQSPTARRFALSSLGQARAYLAHPVLGPRLEEACRALMSLEEDDPVAVLGSLDAMKLRSSMTLFLRAEPGHPLFAAVLERFFSGRPDSLTDGLLGLGGAERA